MGKPTIIIIILVILLILVIILLLLLSFCKNKIIDGDGMVNHNPINNNITNFIKGK